MKREYVEALLFILHELQYKYNIEDEDIMDCFLMLENEREKYYE